MMNFTDNERSELARFGRAAKESGRMDVCNMAHTAAQSPCPVRSVDYDRIMTQYRAWLMFNEYDVKE